MKEILIFCYVLVAFCIVAFGDEKPACRYEGTLRIMEPSQLEVLKDICEITENLLIFRDVGDEIVVPNLRSVNLINIDTNGIHSISFPKLEKAKHILVQTRDLEAIGFESLSRVSGTMYIKSLRLKYLNIPNLEKVGDLYLEDNPELVYVFAESIRMIGGITEVNNPKHADESIANLHWAGKIVTPQERAARAEEEKRIRQARFEAIEKMRQPPPTVGSHGPAQFCTVGCGTYGVNFNEYWHRYGYLPYWNWNYGYYPWRFHYRWYW